MRTTLASLLTLLFAVPAPVLAVTKNAASATRSVKQRAVSVGGRPRVGKKAQLALQLASRAARAERERIRYAFKTNPHLAELKRRLAAANIDYLPYEQRAALQAASRQARDAKAHEVYGKVGLSASEVSHLDTKKVYEVYVPREYVHVEPERIYDYRVEVAQGIVGSKQSWPKNPQSAFIVEAPARAA